MDEPLHAVERDGGWVRRVALQDGTGTKADQPASADVATPHGSASDAPTGPRRMVPLYQLWNRTPPGDDGPDARGTGAASSRTGAAGAQSDMGASDVGRPKQAGAAASRPRVRAKSAARHTGKTKVAARHATRSGKTQSGRKPARRHVKKVRGAARAHNEAKPRKTAAVAPKAGTAAKAAAVMAIANSAAPAQTDRALAAVADAAATADTPAAPVDTSVDAADRGAQDANAAPRAVALVAAAPRDPAGPDPAVPENSAGHGAIWAAVIVFLALLMALVRRRRRRAHVVPAGDGLLPRHASEFSVLDARQPSAGPDAQPHARVAFAAPGETTARLADEPPAACAAAAAAMAVRSPAVTTEAADGTLVSPTGQGTVAESQVNRDPLGGQGRFREPSQTIAYARALVAQGRPSEAANALHQVLKDNLAAGRALLADGCGAEAADKAYELLDACELMETGLHALNERIGACDEG